MPGQCHGGLGTAAAAAELGCAKTKLQREQHQLRAGKGPTSLPQTRGFVHSDNPGPWWRHCGGKEEVSQQTDTQQSQARHSSGRPLSVGVLGKVVMPIPNSQSTSKIMAQFCI